MKKSISIFFLSILIFSCTSLKASDLPYGLCDDLPPSPKIPNDVSLPFQLALIHGERENFKSVIRQLKAASPAERHRFFAKFYERNFIIGNSPNLVCNAIKNLPGAAITLIRLGAPIKPSLCESSPLHDAAHQGNCRIIRELLKACADPNGTTSSWYPNVTPLCLAKDVKTTKTLIKGGAHVNALGANKNTALHLVQDPTIARFLILKGASLEARNGDGLTPLIYAAINEKFEIMNDLLNAGANINARDTKCITPLHYAVMSGQIEAVKILLAAGANKNAVDEKRRDRAR